MATTFKLFGVVDAKMAPLEVDDLATTTAAIDTTITVGTGQGADYAAATAAEPHDIVLNNATRHQVIGALEDSIFRLVSAVDQRPPAPHLAGLVRHLPLPADLLAVQDDLFNPGLDPVVRLGHPPIPVHRVELVEIGHRLPRPDPPGFDPQRPGDVGN